MVLRIGTVKCQMSCVLTHSGQVHGALTPLCTLQHASLVLSSTKSARDSDSEAQKVDNYIKASANCNILNDILITELIAK